MDLTDLSLPFDSIGSLKFRAILIQALAFVNMAGHVAGHGFRPDLEEESRRTVIQCAAGSVLETARQYFKTKRGIET